MSRLLLRTDTRPHSLSEVVASVRHMLTDDDKALLEFERDGWWKYAGAKEQAILDTFGHSSTRYYQRLNAIIDRDEALAHDPMLVRRLRRLRDGRARARGARRLEFMPGRM